MKRHKKREKLRISISQTIPMGEGILFLGNPADNEVLGITNGEMAIKQEIPLTRKEEKAILHKFFPDLDDVERGRTNGNEQNKR